MVRRTLNTYEGFTRVKSEGNRCYGKRNFNQAVRWYTAAIDAAAEAEAATQVEDAMQVEEVMQIDETLAVEKAPKLEMQSPECHIPTDELAKVYANRAACLNELGDYEGGAEDAQAAVRLAPTYAKAYFRLGVALSHRGRGAATRETMQRATAALEESMRLDPSEAAEGGAVARLLQQCRAMQADATGDVG